MDIYRDTNAYEVPSKPFGKCIYRSDILSGSRYRII